MARSFANGVPAGKLTFGDVFDVTVNTFTVAGRGNRGGGAVGGSIVGKWGPTAFAYVLGWVSNGLGGSRFDSAGAAATHVGGGTVTAGVWYSIMGRKKGTGANQFQTFADGVSQATGTENGAQANTADEFRIGLMGFDGPNVGALEGDAADVALWNIDLTDDEVTAYGRGVNPTLLRPKSLVCFIPMYGNRSPEIDYCSDKTGTLSGNTAAATHPGKAGPPAPVVAIAA